MSSWLNTPWMIGGGVEHPVELARLLAYVATGGKEGIIRPTDLEVKALAVPGGQVRVMPGACAILNKQADAESYAGLLPETDVIDIPPTGSGAGANYLLMARVEDPFQPGSGWPVPAAEDIQDTQYIRSWLHPIGSAQYSTLAEAGLAWSGIPLARIEVPVSTATITQGMIVDLRKLYLAQVAAGLKRTIVPNATRTLATTTTVYADWPSDASVSVKVPSWATVMYARVIIGQVGYGAAGSNGGSGWSTNGSARLKMTAAGVADAYPPSVSFAYDSDTGTDRGILMLGAEDFNVQAFAGKTATLKIQAQHIGSTAPLVADGSSTIAIDVDFAEAPVAA